MTTMTTTTMAMQARPAGLTERVVAQLGMRALRWARRRAAARSREAVAASTAHERAIQRREHEWSRLEPIRPR
jgi:hypothetical protein